MATHQFSPKLEEKRPISDALVDDGHNIISESDTPLSNPDMSAYNDSVPEFNDADSKGEGSLRSANEPGNNDEINTLPADDEENVRSDSVVNVKSEDEASKGASDEADGNFLPKIWREERDDEFLKSFEVQLYNLNQQPSNEGGFLKMELDGDTGLKVTTTGFQKDAY
ncbi:Hypothetical predicted protein, partial [Paramuricea clavata]